MTFLSPAARAADARLPGLPPPAPQPVMPGSVSAALRATSGSRPRCSRLRLLPGCDGNQAGGGGEAAQGSLGAALRSRYPSNSVYLFF